MRETAFTRGSDVTPSRFMISTPTNAFLSEDGVLAAVDESLSPNTASDMRTGQGFPVSDATEAYARLRLARPTPSRRGGAPHERGEEWRERPPIFLPLVRHRGG